MVFHQAYFSSFNDDFQRRYSLRQRGTVEREEGPRLLANLMVVDNADIKVGMPVEVVIDGVTEGMTLAKFRPVGKP